MTPGFEDELRAAKDGSLLQRLFRFARLLNGHALRTLPVAAGPTPRPAHMALFPHIDPAGTRPSELAEKLGISRQAVAQLVGDLEAMGMVERRPDPDDGRARRVAFTTAGRRGMLEGLVHLATIEAEVAAELDAATMAKLKEAIPALEAVAEALAARSTRGDGPY